MNDFYDTRVSYDTYAHRFVIIAAVRGADIDGSTDDVARRYVAIAVSRSEDPRDGFEQWITTESNYSDWPRLGVGDGVLVVAHNACKSPDHEDPCDNGHADVLNNTEALRPMMYAFRTADLVGGDRSPKNWKVYPYQVHGGSFYTVVHRGPTAGWTYLVKPQGESLDVYRFDASKWNTQPTLHKESMALSGGTSGFREAVTYWNSSLYLACGVKRAERVPNVSPERWAVRGLRLPVWATPTGWRVGPCPGVGCLDFTFGSRADDDAPGDVWSYEMPSLAVNDDGDMAIAFGRVPISTSASAGQEARYTLYYHDERGLQGSRLVQAGDVVLQDFYCKDNTREPVATAENFWHVWFAAGSCLTQRHYQDYGTAVVDPDGIHFWFAHAHADAARGGFKMVGGMIEP
jgi:hypothetical protein